MLSIKLLWCLCIKREWNGDSINLLNGYGYGYGERAHGQFHPCENFSIFRYNISFGPVSEADSRASKTVMIRSGFSPFQIVNYIVRERTLPTQPIKQRSGEKKQRNITLFELLLFFLCPFLWKLRAKKWIKKRDNKILPIVWTAIVKLTWTLTSCCDGTA